MGVRQMVDTGQQRAPLLAVVHPAAHRGAAEADAMIAALAADQARARALPARTLPGERDLERRIDRLGAGVAVEGVVEITRQHGGMPRRQLERLRMPHLERRREVHLLE